MNATNFNTTFRRAPVAGTAGGRYPRLGRSSASLSITAPSGLSPVWCLLPPRRTSPCVRRGTFCDRMKGVD
jgi:hypothetical protein